MSTSDAITAAVPEVIPVAEELPPPPPAERLPALDLLRGIAILAILPANIPFFSGAVNHWTQEAIPATPADQAAYIAALALVFGKFITILSMLFGAGLALQVWRARAANRPFAAYYIRRMVILLALGLLHGVFLWYGDILSSYAIVGVGALLLSRLSSRVLLGIAAGCLLLLAGWLTVVAAQALLLGPDSMSLAGALAEAAKDPPRDEGEALVQEWLDRLAEYIATDNQTRLWREGSAAEMVLDRAGFLGMYVMQFWMTTAWYILACFLIGMVLLRRGLFHDFEGQRPLIRALVLLGLALGIPLQLVTVGLYVWAPQSSLYLLLPYSLGALPMSLAYIGLVLYWSHSGLAAWLQRALEATGRMALSNYILQSVVCNLLFYSYGLSFYGRLGHAALLGVVAGIWLMAIVLSVLWLRVFQIGPVEWLWRSLAEGRLLPATARPIFERDTATR